VCRRPQNPCDWLEHNRHDFELLHSSQNLKTRSYSKQQVAKNNLAIEPSQGFCSRLNFFFYSDRFRHIIFE
ncbi:hypothetical protein, partial [Companilactobacillus alimentarius]